MPRRLLVAVVVGLFSAACVPPEESNDRIKRYDPEDSIMGVIQERGVLSVGLPDDHPPLAITDGAEPEGFLVDLAELVAESLAVESEYVVAPTPELLDMVHPDGSDPDGETEVDMAFPIVAITEAFASQYTFTDPYWVGHRRTLVPMSPDSSLREPIKGNDLNLLPIAYERGPSAITGPQDSTEGYGAVVRTGAVTFATLVSQVFNEADAEGDWSTFYERWLADYFADPDPEDVPIMSVEDAAALHPEGLE